jgi:saccharopine dehydrogenase-like NADP-dependent oxidoreductase
VQGTAWQTGASAACAVTQFARGDIGMRGVVAPEQLDPVAFIAEMDRVGLSHGVVDLPAG